MIDARGLTRAFGSQVVLAGLDMRIERGERVALLGRNGAGKTTLFRCLLGLIPFQGDLQVAGVDVRRAGREARAAIGYVPQRAPHFDGTLEDLVAFFAGLRGMDAAAVGRRMTDLDLSIEEHGDKPVSALSGGMLQKTLLALAVAEEAPILLLDEPTANLDPKARAEFVRGLRRVPADTTVILSSHRLEDVRAAADRVLVLDAGRLAFDGRLEDLLGGHGIGPTLWIATERLEEAVAVLDSDPRALDVCRNGTRVGVRARAPDIADLLVLLRSKGVPVSGMEVESPTLEAVLGGAPPGPSDGQEDG
jgi:ABC-type multidrug transport system ATPase subunit